VADCMCKSAGGLAGQVVRMGSHRGHYMHMVHMMLGDMQQNSTE